jgi:predicted transcriptional regulator
MVDKKGDKVMDNVEKNLKKNGGMTITDIVKKSNLSRSAVRTALAKLEGADKVFIKNVGMAKIYSLLGDKNEN